MGALTPKYRVDVDGFPIDIDLHANVLEAMEKSIRAGSAGHYISITNTESLYHARRLPNHAAFICGSDFSLCDGVGVIVAAKAAGNHISRYNGPILQLDASAFGASRGWRHFYLGGTNGSAAEMGRRLSAQFPGMCICGIYEPPFRPLTADERAEMIAQIKQSEADIVWVGLGLLKQEAMIADIKDEVGAAWLVGVGAAFDYHSGRVPWAPLFLRNLGLEWLFRLIVQPRLRAKRYWWSGVWMAGAILRGAKRRIFG
ncbi:MAG: WecB/TagA/CpsF family glycosyltransferase [Novosphingobium sp.]|uniref:WecB/TagA/CpsF family glycosyltransferase n=1 Tax=Novosphingobium sp. TaxID=1874826 RepID=UPI0030187451